MKILIIEDETAATVNLLSMIAGVCPEAEVLAALETVADSVEWLESNPAPNLIFMDIHLADGNAFRIFEKTNVAAPVIFTTAYDRYAIDAFHLNSIDYLLKPIKTADLRRAIEKFDRFTGGGLSDYTDRINKMAAGRNNPGSFLVHVKDKIVPVGTEEVAYFHTSDEKVVIATLDGRTYPYGEPLDNIMSNLPGKEFFRANRQFIISRNAIEEISVWFGSRLKVNLKVEAPEKITVSKARVPVFKRWLAGEQ